jgi:hypothetical protein
MKIFIGGGKKKYNDRFSKRYPQVEFEFAAEDEGPQRWLNKAMRCQHHIILSHRTTHTHVMVLSKFRIKAHFTDRIPRVYEIIEELITHGKVGHSYADTAGSQGAVPAATPAAR